MATMAVNTVVALRRRFLPPFLTSLDLLRRFIVTLLYHCKKRVQVSLANRWCYVPEKNMIRK